MSNPTEQEIRAFVGPKADHYLKKWRLEPDGTRSPIGLNWAAFFWSGLWVSFRKMYRVAAILGGIVVLESVLEELGVLGDPGTAKAFGRFVALSLSFVCGGFGNVWYLSHTRKTIAAVRGQGLAEEEHLRELAKRGGSSYGSSLLFLVLLLAGLFAFELLFSPDGGIR